jgi:hypothetical protein
MFTDTLPFPEAEDLRNCLTGYVTTLRALGMAPERVVIAVKALVKESAAQAQVETRALCSAAVTWAITAYFPTKFADGGPRATSRRPEIPNATGTSDDSRATM